jgi:hypothetical protein
VFKNGPFRRSVFAVLLALFLLGVFILVNYYLFYLDSHQTPDTIERVEREILPVQFEGGGSRLAFHDFEWGNIHDTASHLAEPGYFSKQSLKMNPGVPFSPGLWIKFKDIPASLPKRIQSPVSPDSVATNDNSIWIRAGGFVWFSCPPADLKCSLVATCNHNGANYKYMFVGLETENLISNQWNYVSIDYRVPSPADPEDVLQAYFWFRGDGEMLVDDVEVNVFTEVAR